MLNYKLAKKLKEVGLKHNCTDDCYFNITAKNPICCNWHLEELIEECGEGFDTLTKIHENKWRAGRFGYVSALGKNPLKAVANLYIKINEKSKRNFR